MEYLISSVVLTDPVRIKSLTSSFTLTDPVQMESLTSSFPLSDPVRIESLSPLLFWQNVYKWNRPCTFGIPLNFLL